MKQSALYRSTRAAGVAALVFAIFLIAAYARLQLQAFESVIMLGLIGLLLYGFLRQAHLFLQLREGTFAGERGIKFAEEETVSFDLPHKEATVWLEVQADWSETAGSITINGVVSNPSTIRIIGKRSNERRSGERLVKFWIAGEKSERATGEIKFQFIRRDPTAGPSIFARITFQGY